LYSINSSASRAIVSTGVTVAWQEIFWSINFFLNLKKNNFARDAASNYPQIETKHAKKKLKISNIPGSYH
jgi:hypothetical protein